MPTGADVADILLARVMARARLASRGYHVVDKDDGRMEFVSLSAVVRPGTAPGPRCPPGDIAWDASAQPGGGGRHG